jgi:hypothetical protein
MEESRLRMSEDRMLRKTFGLRREEVTGEWRRLHNEQLYDSYSLSDIVRVITKREIIWAGHVVLMGERRGANVVLVGKLER